MPFMFPVACVGSYTFLAYLLKVKCKLKTDSFSIVRQTWLTENRTNVYLCPSAALFLLSCTLNYLALFSCETFSLNPCLFISQFQVSNALMHIRMVRLSSGFTSFPWMTFSFYIVICEGIESKGDYRFVSLAAATALSQQLLPDYYLPWQ